MKTRQTPVIAARKSPRQARSTQLVSAILEAAVRVPNKEAILFRLQTDEWRQTGDLLTRILGDPQLS